MGRVQFSLSSAHYYPAKAFVISQRAGMRTGGDTVCFNLRWGKACRVTGKLSAEQYCMMPEDSKNVYRNSRLQSLNFTLKYRAGLSSQSAIWTL